MYTKSSLLNDIKNMGIKPEDILLVHSSMKAVGEVEGGAETVLDALAAAVSQGLLILPAHTWATVTEEHAVYDPETEPACVGILPDLFLKREGVKRSLHPTHSLAALGSGAEAFLSGEENTSTPCGKGGCYRKLYERNAKILLLGCGLNRNTYMHGIEEWFGLTERLTDFIMPLQVKMPDGTLKDTPMRRHFKPDGVSISEYYVKMEEPMLQNNILIKAKIGSADCMLMEAVPTAELFTKMLEKDKDIFTNHIPVPRDWYMGKL